MAGRDEPGPILNGLPSQLPDIDPDETQEWLDSFDAAVDERGRTRARYLMLQMLQRARERGVGVPSLRSTDYINTIPPEAEPWFPGDEDAERAYRRWIRWNAAIMVHRAQRPGISVGGHISTYASSATLYEVGFNHFFRGKDHPGGGDQVFIQGHASPGIYARAYLEGRLTTDQLDGFRQERSHAGGGLPSYPHPRLMPDFWEFPTVSMGLGPINAIYQAQFNKYLHARGVKRHLAATCLGLPRRRRDGRAGEPRGAAARRIRGAGQPHVRRQLQPAAPRRARTGQRQDHPGAGVVLPRSGLERHQGRVGPGVGPAAGRRPRPRAGEPDERHAGRGLPDVPGRGRLLHPGELLRPRPAHPPTRRAHDRRRHLGVAPRWPRLPQGLRRLQAGHPAHGPADRRPRQDDQGLGARPALRRAQRDAPDEEARPRRPHAAARPPADPDHRHPARAGPVRRRRTTTRARTTRCCSTCGNGAASWAARSRSAASRPPA